MSNYKIVKKSQLWKLIPLAGRNRFSTTLGDKIYLTPKRYDDWKSGSPKKSTIALIAHEQVHVDQFRRDPAFKQRYVTSRKWRLQYEVEGYAKQAYVRVQLGSSTIYTAKRDGNVGTAAKGSSRKWRLQYEAEGYAKQVYVRVQLGSRRNRHDYVSRHAKVLASKTYLLFLPYDEVYAAIDREYGKLL